MRGRFCTTGVKIPSVGVCGAYGLGLNLEGYFFAISGEPPAHLRAGEESELLKKLINFPPF